MNNCKHCGKQTKNDHYCSKKCNVVRRYGYDTHSFCRTCKKWRLKEQTFCEVCSQRVSHAPRLSRAKKDDRWLKAY
jgi:hypothetical protein